MEIAERMRHWQAAIKQSNNGKDTPLSDDCARAADEIDRLVGKKYPADVRLAADGETSICDQCGRRWRPLKGEGPNCAECSKAWARIANGHERKQNG